METEYFWEPFFDAKVFLCGPETVIRVHCMVVMYVGVKKHKPAEEHKYKNPDMKILILGKGLWAQE